MSILLIIENLINWNRAEIYMQDEKPAFSQSDKFLFLTGAIAAVLAGLLLASCFAGHQLVIDVAFLIWLFLGETILHSFFNFPHQAHDKLPRHAFLIGVALVVSWLLWPLWAAILDRKK
jgi:hypothetical protein